MKVVFGFALLFVLGALASGALGQVTEGIATPTDTTATDTSAPSTTDRTSTDTVPTDSTATATDTSPAASEYGTTPTDSTTTTTTSTGSPVPYIVTFKDGVSDATQQADISAAGGTPGDAISVLSMYSVTFPAGADGTDAAALLANPDVAAVDQDHSRDTAAIPNDPSYGDQWSLPQIGWENAYGSVTPGASVTVAILDTGVDATHPDLAGAVVPGKNIIDGSSNTSDDNGHGTAMAGIVAATTDNNEGIAGVGYAGVKVRPVKGLGSDGTGLDSDVINGVVYATQHGANIILMSFSNPGYSSALQSAIDYAWSHDVVLVAASGNDGSSAVN
jgi:subtilisin family serine protease